MPATIASLVSALKGTLQGPAIINEDWWGTVTVVNAGPPPTVTATVNGTTSVITCLYASAYALSGPTVGDVVFGRRDTQGDYWVMDTLTTGASIGPTVPLGGCIWTPVTITDASWLLCNGGTFSATTYPALNTLLGGNTLPDLVNYLPAGTGLVAARATAGSKTHALTTAELASHTHTGAAHTHSHSHGASNSQAFMTYAGGVGGSGVSAGTGVSTDLVTDTDATSTTPGAGGSAGSGTAHSILNPVTGGYYYMRSQ
jgi:microcystin-dependent protein